MKIAEFKPFVEARLAELAPEREFPPVWRAMRYSLLAGGKRLRPCMLLAAAEMLGADWRECLDYACALEMIHTYSLIHDDLPAMDDDTLRRGRATNHVVFGEGQAILAGDGLLNLAYETMLRDIVVRREPVPFARAAFEIASGAGVQGMVMGQSLDLACETDKSGGADELNGIHLGKTCQMFMGAMRAAGRLADASEADMEALTEYARNYGLAFQFVDDLLDVTSTPEELGKSIGKDAAENKLTALSVWGREGLIQKAGEYARGAEIAISRFDGSEEFALLARNTLERKK